MFYFKGIRRKLDYFIIVFDFFFLIGLVGKNGDKIESRKGLSGIFFKRGRGKVWYVVERSEGC